MIPCKECLILPACRNRAQVKCSLLFVWLSDKKNIRDGTTQEIIKKCFPNLKTFLRFPGRKDDVVYFSNSRRCTREIYNEGDI